MNLQEINHDYIAIHKQELFYTNIQSIKNLSNMLEYLNGELEKDQNRDLNEYEIEELEGLLEKSKTYIQNIQHLIKIKRRGF